MRRTPPGIRSALPWGPLLTGLLLSPVALADDPALYDTPTYSWSTESLQFTYDAQDAPARRIKVMAYLSDAPGERPVVLLSHGGSKGMKKAGKVLVAWAQHLASHGYAVVAVAHPARSDDEKDALCDFLQYPAGETCDSTMAWDRPFDIEQVLDRLEIRAAAQWDGLIDTTRIGLLGHSGGANGALVVGGAERAVGSMTLAHDDDRITSIVAASAAGVAPDNGFGEDSWATVNVPALMLTGSHDITSPDQPEGFRTDAFFGLPVEADNYMLFLTSPGTKHELFRLRAVECRAAVSNAECREMTDALKATALAHFDATLLDVGAAQDWLEDDVVEAVVELAEAELTSGVDE